MKTIPFLYNKLIDNCISKFTHLGPRPRRGYSEPRIYQGSECASGSEDVRTTYGSDMHEYA